MDPLTQGTLGAALPQAVARRADTLGAGLLGFLAGMAPDLDVLIRSSEDPLLFLEYHRQFTHALVFIPVGGLLCALVLHGLIGRRRQLDFRSSLLFCTLGYGTHALLDACTTYGTLLFWPFSEARVAWNTVSVIDPLFTLPLLGLILLATLRRQPQFARIGLAWAFCYLAMGLVQRDRAIAAGYELAASRGHTPITLEAKPSFANIVVWKIVYRAGGSYYVDAVRAGIEPSVYEGEQVAILDLDRDFPWLEHSSQQARDVERFRWFSNDYLARDPDQPNRIIDIRYSLLPNEVRGLWSIELSPDAGPQAHVGYSNHRDAGSAAVDMLLAMIAGSADSGSQTRFGGG